MTTKPRFVLCHEKQTIEWSAGNDIPEVVPAYSVVLGYFDSRDEALQSLNAQLAMLGAKAQWSDVRPIEACACCRSDFSTAKAHFALVLSVECGPEESPSILAVEYPALFCAACAPTASAMQSAPGSKQ